MISLSRLYCGHSEFGDSIRYAAHHARPPAEALAEDAPAACPVVVWNITRRCNLRCLHCYAGSSPDTDAPELSDAEGRELLRHLAQHGTKVILFSGGEPLLRPELPAWVEYASGLGLRPVLSTNGILLTDDVIRRLKAAGLSYAGISLDGNETLHNRMRQSDAAFAHARRAILRCLELGLKAGVRFTLTGENARDLPWLLDLVEAERIPRLCVYHLAASGRGAQLGAQRLDPHATRACLDLILDRTAWMHREQGHAPEILTVDNHADGIHLYLRMKREGHPRTDEVLRLLTQAGGNRSGEKIGCIRWDGTVLPDQFWESAPLGNIHETPFHEIWQNAPLLHQLRMRETLLTGRCRRCRWIAACRGNLRARAEALTGDRWAPDPACHLTDDEIA